MARRKNYVKNEAIELAMLTFWEKGFGNVGVREIEQRTAVNRFALQTEFGGKEGLFLEALDKYLQISDSTSLKPLASGGLESLKDFFIALATSHGADDPRHAGCLMVNTVIENAEHRMESVKAMTDKHYENMQTMFRYVLKAAQERGELSEGFDIDAASKYLLTFAMGVEVYIRMHSDVKAAQAQTDFIIKEIDGWRVNT